LNIVKKQWNKRKVKANDISLQKSFSQANKNKQRSINYTMFVCVCVCVCVCVYVCVCVFLRRTEYLEDQFTRSLQGTHTHSQVCSGATVIQSLKPTFKLLNESHQTQ